MIFMDKKMDAMHSEHMKHKGIMMIIIGVLIILNAMYAWFNWATFVGGIFVFVGLKALMVYKKK